MKSSKRPSRTSAADNRYDINRTLRSYQPTATRQASTPAIAPTDHIPAPTTAQREQQIETKKSKIHWKRAIAIVLLLLITPLLIIGAWDYRNVSPASKKLFGSGNLFSALVPTNIKSTDGRINILLIGYSADDPGHAGAQLTDSIMIVSLDKKDKTGFMLSVPRDLYVAIPNYGSAKINEAYQAGERQGFAEPGYLSGGTGLLQKVVHDTFGIDLHYSVTINYGAVREITDSIGGITVNIESTDPRGIYDPNFKPEEGGPLQLSNGQHHIDGQTALRLTRARGSTNGSYGFPLSDFNRTQNQQKVFAAIKSALSTGFLIDPRVNKPFFDALANNIQTSIGIHEVLPIYRAMRSVPDSAMQQINLSNVDKVNYLKSYRTPSGQSALIPAAGVRDFSEIQTLVQKMSN